MRDKKRAEIDRLCKLGWIKFYPPKWGINLFAKGDGFAI